ncbi:lipase PAD4 [Trifolium repens]|nr:lipase PAD4 [Trifolium repens]
MAANEASPFESSEMLATFLISTPLLPESWRLCSQANAAHVNLQRFVVERVGAVVYVAFTGVEMAGGSDPSWRTLVPLEIIGDVPLFPYRHKKTEEPVMVHEGMLNLFSSLFNSIQNQVLALLKSTNTKSLVITGHSIGGATASLCTLWLLSYLQSISSSLSVMCITFGSPLLGNKSFSQAISKERWDGNFIHVVSNHDIVPRLLFAPITPLTSQLNFLLPFWHLSSTSPEFGKLAVQVSDNEKAKLFTAVLDYLEAATHNGEASGSILFHPFGNYFFVSEEGAVCVDRPVTIIKMMHLLLSTSSPSGNIESLKYGEYVNRLSMEMLNQQNSLLRNIPNSSYEAGLELAIQSSGLADKESAVIPAKECLKLARRMGPSPALIAASLALQLSKVNPYRAQIEWYKSWCDEQEDEKGYYDSFKTRGASKRDLKVNMNRHKLARFWNNVIDMLEKNELPHDFDRRAKWVNASQVYKLLFEPLDIAEYYGKGMHRTKGHYIEHGRERRYHIFDRWWKNRKVTSGEQNKERSRFPSSTQDSCFWAKVEEARDWLNCTRSERDTNKLAMLWEKIEHFEKYAIELIQNKEVSCDVLAKNSSYSTWVEDLKEMKQLRANVPRHPQ